MGRLILAVVVSYVAIFAFVFITFTVAFLGMGADRAFQPGTYDVSLLWVVVSLVLGILAAILGGWLVVRISAHPKAGPVLAGVVFVLGTLMAIPALMESANGPGSRAADVSSMEAMQQAQQPKWMTAVNPVLGMVGVMVGARRKQ